MISVQKGWVKPIPLCYYNHSQNTVFNEITSAIRLECCSVKNKQLSNRHHSHSIQATVNDVKQNFQSLVTELILKQITSKCSNI